MGTAERVPVHVGIIMDGNGRWAKKRLMPRNYGHSAGMKTMIKLAEHAKSAGIKYLTVYALSTENLSRPAEEVEALFTLFRKYFTENLSGLYKSGARVKVIGDVSALPDDIQTLIADGERNSPADAQFTLIIAMNYGSRSEMLSAVNRAAAAGGSYTEEEFSRLLYTDGIPDPDLIIRTGGELRLSNFLLWQAAYSELYFTDVYFPDFGVKQFDKALAEYAGRERRFGKV